MRARFISVVSIFIWALVACTPEEPIYEAGTYEGCAQGYHSLLTVRVETDTYNIIDVEVLGGDETPIISEIVYSEIPKAVIKANSTDVDAIAGATYTSKTLLKAIENGLEKARLQKSVTEEER